MWQCVLKRCMVGQTYIYHSYKFEKKSLASYCPFYEHLFSPPSPSPKTSTGISEIFWKCSTLGSYLMLCFSFFYYTFVLKHDPFIKAFQFFSWLCKSVWPVMHRHPPTSELKVPCLTHLHGLDLLRMLEDQCIAEFWKAASGIYFLYDTQCQPATLLLDILAFQSLH